MSLDKRPLLHRIVYALAFIALWMTPAGSSATAPEVSNLQTVFLPMTINPPMFGVLQPDTHRQIDARAAGLRARTLEIGWNLYEPRDDVWGSAYIDQQRALASQLRAAGFSVILDIGVQNPPDWVMALPNSRYINQYGDVFPAGLGNNGVNAVFNGAIRDYIANYVEHVFADLGTDFYAVRVGMGQYNELMYPPTLFSGHTNSYWCFDAIAQGSVAGLPFGMTAAPNLSWRPGMPSDQHREAAAFINWYLESLHNFHDWQIAAVRRAYPGKIMMLYPSWGLRPGDVDAAIAADLNGTTSSEINGELQRGLDFARFIVGIRDPDVVLYTTWLEAPDGGDGGPSSTTWSPARFFTALAAAHPLPLRVWGENSGHNNYADMQRCIRQVQVNAMGGMLWAFERDLYTDARPTLTQYKTLMRGAP